MTINHKSDSLSKCLGISLIKLRILHRFVIRDLIKKFNNSSTRSSNIKMFESLIDDEKYSSLEKAFIFDSMILMAAESSKNLLKSLLMKDNDLSESVDDKVLGLS